jgi:hypothetical protein
MTSGRPQDASPSYCAAEIGVVGCLLSMNCRIGNTGPLAAVQLRLGSYARWAVLLTSRAVQVE